MHPFVPFGGSKRKFHAKLFVTSVSRINIAGFLKLDLNLSVRTVKPQFQFRQNCRRNGGDMLGKNEFYVISAVVVSVECLEEI